MAIKELRKAKKEDLNDLIVLLKSTDYSFDKISIKNIDSEKLKIFIEEILDFFYILTVNNKITAFCLAYSSNNSPDKFGFFKDYFSTITNLKLLFNNPYKSKEIVSGLIIDYIYFEENEKNYKLFFKYLTIEKYRLGLDNIFASIDYLNIKKENINTINIKSLALYNFIKLDY